MLCEAVVRLLVFVSVIPPRVVIRVLFLYEIQLHLVEKCKVRIHILKPWMSVDLLIVESLMRINFKETSQHRSCFLRNIIFQSIPAFKDEFMELFHVISFERNGSVEHREKYNTS